MLLNNEQATQRVNKGKIVAMTLFVFPLQISNLSLHGYLNQHKQRDNYEHFKYRK